MALPNVTESARQSPYHALAVKRLACLLLASLLLAQGPALAQVRERPRLERQDAQPRERARQDRSSMHRERMDRSERHREHRFSREERDKLRQDLLDANRDMKRRR
jgi:hypothetical protein